MAAFAPPWLALPIDLVMAAGLVGITAVEWIARERRVAAAPNSTTFDLVRALVWALAVVTTEVALYFAGPGLSPEARERRFIAISLVIAAISLAVGTAWRVRLGFTRRSRTAGANLVLDPCLVLFWSLIVRFVLTEANILTDGGSGYVRLLEGPIRFSGLSVLVQAVMPSSLQGLMWPSTIVPRIAAALTPALLTAVARQLGIERRVGVLAGLCLASYPLHAAMFSSDFLISAVPALGLFSLILMLAGRSEGGEGLFAAGVLVMAYCVWIRPDAMLAVAPAGLLVFLFPIRFWLRPAVVAPLAWLIGTAIVYALTWDSLQTTLSGREIRLWGHWSTIPFGEMAGSWAVLPSWLWLPVVPGLLFLPGVARWIALVGVIFGMASAHFGTPGDPTTETWMEVFRYSAAAMPWIALFAAAGMVGVVDGLGRIGGLILGETHLRDKVRHGLFATVAVAVVATPLWHRSYLSRQYQNKTDEEAFLAALRLVPPECGLVVPDDEAEDSTGHSGGVEAFVRYRLIAKESVRRHEILMDPLHVVGLQAFRRAMGPLRRLPYFAEVRMRFFEVARDTDAPACWYFYEGTYCAPGLPNFPTTRCLEFLESEPHRQVATWPIEFWSHRLITRPKLRVPPFYASDRILALYRLTRP